jgi:myo-inositol-1(or 4)-monophosphatase
MPVERNPPAGALSDMAVEIATGTGKLIRTQRHKRFAVDTKSTPTDMVTDVDRRAEAYILEQLSARRPDDAVLGEEGGGHAGGSGVRWLVDPIDGTVNFVLDLPQYAVSIAAEVDGQVIAACVHNPVSGEVFRAALGSGAFVGDERLTGPRDISLDRAVVGTGFAYAGEVRGRQGAVVAQLLPRIADIRRAGSAALDLCATAAGRLDAYFEVGLNPWDWSAGVLIASEAGCAVTGLRGRAPTSTMTAVAGAHVAADFFNLLEELGADRVT